MAYVVHEFQSGEVLMAGQLNEMDAQIASNESAASDRSYIAAAYSVTPYSKGSLVVYGGEIWEAVVDITVAEAWNSVHWKQATVNSRIKELNEDAIGLREDTDYLLSSNGGKSPAIYDSPVSGSIVSFDSNTEDMSLKSLSVSIDPVQDLHGYDNPWPAGGGKNLVGFTLPSTMGSSSTTLSTTDFVKPTAGTYVRPSGKFSDGTVLSDMAMIIRSGGSSGTQIMNMASTRGYLVPDTISNADTVTCLIPATYANKTLTELQLETVAGESSSSTSYVPYSNICPISGHTAVTVTRTGFNLFDKENSTVFYAYCHADGGSYYWSQLYDSRSIAIQCMPNTTYCVHVRGIAPSILRVGAITEETLPTTPTSGGWNIQFEKAYENSTSGTTIYTTGNNAKWLIVQSNAVTFDDVTDNLCVNISDSAKNGTYTPYQGQSVTVQLGQTVYGGTLDVTTGTLTVDRAIVDLGTLTWSMISVTQGNLFRASVSGIKQVADSLNLVCSAYKTTTPANRANCTISKSTGLNVDVIENSYGSASAFTSGVSGVQLCYELATPIVIDNLDQATITTILGLNHVFASTGDIAVEYPLDTKNYIDSKNEETVINLSGDITDLKTAINQLSGKKYGVSGVGGSASALTRLWDSVGMVAQVGTDGDNSAVVNDFDSAIPFMRRKCVGKWQSVNGVPVFRVYAYQGDADYAEDGTMGDYVAVECPLAYYYFKNGVLGVSDKRHDGWKPFDIFCRNHNPQDVIPYVYLPAYALALKNGKAVSLPGLDNFQGCYKDVMDACRTYDGDGVQAKAHCQPMAVNFYEWALFTVEFATQNCQSVMQGCAGLRHNNDDRATLRSDGKWLLSNYYASRVVGEYISIQPTNIDINAVAYYASHKITAITRCDAEGNASASGAYQLMETDDLGLGREYTAGESYRIAARPYRTGECNDVSTPSGSPVSNSDSYHPMKYRWRENVYSNQYKTVADLFNMRVGTGDDDWKLEWYFLPDPEDYTPSSTSKPDAAELANAPFVKLDIETAHANYVSGYIKTKQFSEDYPDIWIPGETTGGSGSTYYADYAYLVNSNVVRAVRLGGNWNNGASVGFSYLSGIYAPSSAFASYGGDLFFPQAGVNAA